MSFDSAANSPEWFRLSDQIKQFCERHFHDYPPYIILPFTRHPEGRLPLILPGSWRADAGPQPVQRRRGAPYHTSDYQLVRWKEYSWNFSPKQRVVIRLLWEAWEKGAPEVPQRTLLDAAESECDSLAELFKKHPAWGVLVTRAGPTIYRLAFPTPEEDPAAEPDGGAC